MAQLLPFSIRLQRGASLFIPRFSSWRSISVQIALYAAIAVVGTVFFFFLHHLGNQIPFDLAKERFAEEDAYITKMLNGDVRHVPGIQRGAALYCEISVLILVGGRRDEGDNAFEDAIILKNAGWRKGCGNQRNDITYSSDEETTYQNKGIAKTRYWWGTKALYAIALQYLTFYEVHQIIRIGTYGAYLLLTASLALMGWRAFLTGFPIILFGIFLSSIWLFTDVQNGMQSIWSLISASILALALWRNASTRVVHLVCFITGMVDSYLWFSGYFIFSIPLIAMLCWVGYANLEPSDRVRKSLICIALYILGFSACFALGQATKSVVYERMIADGHNYFGGEVSRILRGGISGNLGWMTNKVTALFTGRDYGACIVCGDSGWRNLLVAKQLIEFWHMTHMSNVAERALGFFSALALFVSATLAILNVLRGSKEAMWSVVFVLGLMVVVCLQFILPSGHEPVIVRFTFLLPALCWSSLALVLINSNRRTVIIVASGFAVAISLMLIWWSINALYPAVPTRGADTVIRSDFDVYFDEDRLIYIKDDCDTADVAPRFFLHVIPSDPTDLPLKRQEYSFDNIDFNFYEHKLPLLSETRFPFLTRCAATVDLPQYDISAIKTGQLKDTVLLWVDWQPVYRGSGNDQSTDDEPLWSGRFNPGAVNGLKVLQEVRQSGIQPDIESDFNVYLHEDSLVYAKSPCSDNDRDARFFLHVDPADLNDLPDERHGYNFDNLDFTLMEHGLIIDGGCVAVVDLPKYRISDIRTGQLDENGERVWEGMFNVPAARALNLSQEIQQSGIQPEIESDFNVYLYDDKLIYVKSLCSDNDSDTRLFLHIDPEDLNDLPDERHGYNFDNLDFTMMEHGLAIDGVCVAVVDLPEYRVSEIRTGQLDENGEKMWEGKIAVNDSSLW